MGGIVDAITGESSRRQARLAQAAQDAQAQRLADEKARLDRAEKGQRLVGQRGGNGLLAFVENSGLRKVFGS